MLQHIEKTEMKKFISGLLFIVVGMNSYSQIETIDVADLTIKIGGAKTKELFYGFAKGDIIIFNFEEINGKPLKEIEITELPTNSKFMDFKSTSIIDKKIKVNKTAVYKFSFKNSTLKGKICKVSIKRIAKAEDLIDFNTEWEWKTLYDTTYAPYSLDSLIGYDTTYVTKSRKELFKTDTLVTELFNKVETVHSSTNLNHSQYSYVNVNLPNNTFSPNVFNPYETTEVIAWSYWIGVGQQSTEQYEKVNSQIENGLSALGALSGYGALASFAVTGVSMFKPANTGDNVVYKFKYVKNEQTYTFDSGDGISASGRNTKLTQGGFTIVLYNDNFKDGINVTVKVVAVQLRKTWQDVEYQEMLTKPNYITLNKQKMNVETREIRINSK
jgi:hypothetical protein